MLHQKCFIFDLHYRLQYCDFFNQKSYMHGSFGNTGSRNYAI